MEDTLKKLASKYNSNHFYGSILDEFDEYNNKEYNDIIKNEHNIHKKINNKNKKQNNNNNNDIIIINDIINELNKNIDNNSSILLKNENKIYLMKCFIDILKQFDPDIYIESEILRKQNKINKNKQNKKYQKRSSAIYTFELQKFSKSKRNSL